MKIRTIMTKNGNAYNDNTMNTKFHIAQKMSRYLNRENIFSENETNWLTYFNPKSKLRVQFAKNIGCSGVKDFDNFEDARKVIDQMRQESIKDLMIVKVNYLPDGIASFTIPYELKYIIDVDDNAIAGSGCEDQLDIESDAESHMRTYTDKEREHLFVNEIEVEEN